MTADPPHSVISVLLRLRHNRAECRVVLVCGRTLHLTPAAVGADGFSARTVAGEPCGVIIPFRSLESIDHGVLPNTPGESRLSPVNFADLLHNARALGHKLTLHTRTAHTTGRLGVVNPDTVAVIGAEGQSRLLLVAALVWVRVHTD